MSTPEQEKRIPEQEKRSSRTGRTIGAIFAFFGVLTITVVIIQAVGVLTDYVKVKFGLPTVANSGVQIADAPVDLIPNASTAIGSSEQLKQLVLNNQPYTPSSTAATDKAVYQKEAIRLILNGDFEIAQLHITGVVNESGPHFLDLIFGKTAGTLYGVRYSSNTLNTTLTQQNGGVFTTSKPINITIDLLQPVQLSTTRTEYENTSAGSKVVKLWETSGLSPTFVSLLVAPFNQFGHFGGAKVQSTLEYKCKVDDDCKAALCSADEHVASCIKDKFGTPAANQWCQRYGTQPCHFDE